jgi:hypothetical protein
MMLAALLQSYWLIHMQIRNNTEGFETYLFMKTVWLICLIRSSFSVTATVNVVYVCDLSFLEADMFLVLIQAMGG